MIVTYSRLGSNGRLGNQLWQIAGTIAVAFDHDHAVRFPQWEHQSWFNIPQEWFNASPGIESTDIANVPEHTRDYLQHYPLLVPWECLLRKYFQPGAGVDIAQFENKFSPHTAAAVHVRRGDYAEAWRGHGMLSRDYYLENWPKGRVLVFSDDPQWCSDNLPGEVVHINPIVDLMLMRQCQEFLISNSSLAWWGAWLANRPTIYPEPWFVNAPVGSIAVPGWKAVPRAD